MRRSFLVIFLSVFLFATNLSAQTAGEGFAAQIAKNTTDIIYNLENDQLPAIVKPYMEDRPQIGAVRILDTLDNSVIFSGFRDGTEISINRPIPDNLLKLPTFKSEALVDEQVVGLVEVFVLDQNGLNLTVEEQNWIANNPVITVGVEDWYPFIRSDGAGGFDGVAGDFLKLVLDRSGLKAKALPDVWSNLLEDFKAGEIDLLPATYYADERTQYGLYSSPYFSGREFLFVREDNTDIRSFEDMVGKKIAIPKDFGTIPKIKAKYPDIEILETENQVDSIYSVLNGQADATFELQIVMEQILLEELITGLKAVPQDAFEASELFFFSQPDKPLLNSILSKALDSITEEERKKIIGKWLSSSSIKREAVPEKEITEEATAIPVLVKIIVVGFLLLLVLFLAIYFLGKTRHEVNLSKVFGSRAFRVSILCGLSFLLAIVVVMNWVAISDAEKRTAEKVERELQLVLNNSIDRVATWVKDRTTILSQLGRDKEIVRLTTNMINLPETMGSTAKAALFGEARGAFASTYQVSSSDFMVIAPNGTTLLSRDHHEIGQPNALAKVNPALLAQVFDGEAVFIPPTKENGGEMFFIAPIFDPTKGVLAGFAERLHGKGTLSDNLRMSRIGLSGETYAVNAQGKMISESRFKNELLSLGFKVHADGSGIDIDLRQPGGDLTAGFEPKQAISDRPYTEMMADVLRMKEDGLGYEVFKRNTLVTARHPGNAEGYDDYRGVKVVGAWTWMRDLGFGLTSELDHAEAYEDLFVFRQNTMFISGIATVLAIGTTLFTLLLGQRSHRDLMQAHDELEDKVTERTQELQQSTDKLKHAYATISSSINYASYIQQSVLPDLKPLEGVLKDHFVIWEPRDVVGGDMYWCDFWGDGIHLTLADCTGHGVPGAFVTLLASGAFKEAKNEVVAGDLGAVITRFHRNLQYTLGQHSKEGSTDDGLELGSCYIDPEMTTLTFVGARFDLFIVNGDKVDVIKGTKKGLGYRKIPKNQAYESHEIKLTPGYRYYMTSDGLIDQVGGERKRGFGKKRFKALLLGVQHLPMDAQKAAIMAELETYQGEQIRRDDVSLIGFQVV